jgi:hypothetical protein
MNRKHTTRKFIQEAGILPINDAVQIKAAEYWLKLGEADQALKELETLTYDTWNHPSAVIARVAAVGALRESNEFAVH